MDVADVVEVFSFACVNSRVPWWSRTVSGRLSKMTCWWIIGHESREKRLRLWAQAGRIWLVITTEFSRTRNDGIPPIYSPHCTAPILCVPWIGQLHFLHIIYIIWVHDTYSVPSLASLRLDHYLHRFSWREKPRVRYSIADKGGLLERNHGNVASALMYAGTVVPPGKLCASAADDHHYHPDSQSDKFSRNRMALT
jgi:hypothetical protein